MVALRWLAELSSGIALLGVALMLVRPVRDAPRMKLANEAPLPAPNPPASSPEHIASYSLQARLDALTHRVKGRGTIAWQNKARVPVSSLFFHLYLNAFKNDRTLFFRSPFGAGRGGGRPRDYGYIDVQSLRARELGNVDLWKARSAHSPGDPEDETDIEVTLPRAVAPGERLTLDVEFESQLPEIVERTGYFGSFHMVAQWFPKLARLEADGRFAHFAFHAQSEFYADYGRYDVTLDVPESYRVGASGTRVEEQRAEGRLRVRHIAEPVHDFAWSAWDEFQEKRVELSGVQVTLLYPPGYEASSSATSAALAHSLPELSRRFGAYPYRTLTVVHPPAGAESAGGMEYPSLITTGGPWYLPYTGLRALDAVTVHELGHQWFYGILGSNESQAPFLDEGLTSFAEMKLLSARFGASSAASVGGLEVAEESIFRAVAASRAADEAIAEPAAHFSSFNNLGALVYSRSATVLETIARVWGRERLDRALASYTRAKRFAHPTATDLLQAVREHVGSAAANLLERALFARGTVNFVLRDVQNAKRQAPAGFFERANGRERIARGEEQLEGYSSRVTVYRQGSLELPVEVLLVYADGSRELVHWDGRGEWHSFDVQRREPLAFALVDPAERVLLDDNLFDNQAAAQEQPQPRVHERLAYWAALLLGGIAP